MVIALLGVLAAFAVPRMLAGDARKARQSVERAEDLLTVVAQRQSLGGHRMALSYDRKAGELRLDALRVVGERRRDAEPEWGRDPLAPGAALDGLILESARFDGRPADERGWRVEFVPGSPRPLIELTLRDAGRPTRAWLVELMPYAFGATTAGVRPGELAEGGALRSVDLDGAGRSDVPW